LDGAYFFKNILIDFNKSYDFLLLLRLCRLWYQSLNSYKAI
jgi:hypothetical protein